MDAAFTKVVSSVREMKEIHVDTLSSVTVTIASKFGLLVLGHTVYTVFSQSDAALV